MDFLKILLISLIFCFTFFFFGGWMLFDFSRHVYLPIAACAFVIAVAAYLFTRSPKGFRSSRIASGSSRKSINPDRRSARALHALCANSIAAKRRVFFCHTIDKLRQTRQPAVLFSRVYCDKAHDRRKAVLF